MSTRPRPSSPSCAGDRSCPRDVGTLGGISLRSTLATDGVARGEKGALGASTTTLEPLGAANGAAVCLGVERGGAYTKAVTLIAPAQITADTPNGTNGPALHSPLNQDPGAADIDLAPAPPAAPRAPTLLASAASTTTRSSSLGASAERAPAIKASKFSSCRVMANPS